MGAGLPEWYNCDRGWHATRTLGQAYGVQEKLETKASNDNLKGLRQFGWPPPFSPHVPGNPGWPNSGLRQLSPPIHPDLPGNTEGRGKGGLRQFPIFYGR